MSPILKVFHFGFMFQSNTPNFKDPNEPSAPRMELPCIWYSLYACYEQPMRLSDIFKYFFSFLWRILPFYRLFLQKNINEWQYKHLNAPQIWSKNNICSDVSNYLLIVILKSLLKVFVLFKILFLQNLGAEVEFKLCNVSRNMVNQI